MVSYSLSLCTSSSLTHTSRLRLAPMATVSNCMSIRRLWFSPPCWRLVSSTASTPTYGLAGSSLRSFSASCCYCCLHLFTIPSAQAGSSPMSTATTISCSDPPTSGFVNHSALPSHFCRGICTVHGSWAMPRVTWSSCVTSEKRSPILTWPPLYAVIVVKGLHGLHHHQGGDRRRGRRGRRPSRRCLLVPQMSHQL